MRILLAMLGLVLGASGARAGSGVEITPRAGYQLGSSLNTEDGELRFDPGPLFGLFVDVPIQPNGCMEFRYDHYDGPAKLHDETLGGEVEIFDVAINSIQFGGLLDLQPGSVRPFLAATLGVEIYDPKPQGYSTATRLAGTLGGGGRFYLNRRVGLRVQGTLEAVFFGGNSSVFCSSGHCLVTLSGSAVARGTFSGGLILRF